MSERYVVLKDDDVDPIDMAVWAVVDKWTGTTAVHFDTREAAQAQADFRNRSIDGN